MVEFLGISRTTLMQLKRTEFLVQGRHWTRKNPKCPHSDLLWHTQRCEMALGRI